MTTAKRAGRPRDPEVEERALEAARSAYAERGWSGFTLDDVARRSGIGKSSLYLRWPNKAELLVEAIRSRTEFISDIDTGELRSDLVEFATAWLEHMSTDEGALTARLVIDAQFSPELREAVTEDPYPEHVRATRAIVRRGIQRGELPEGTSVAIIADLIAGGASNHARTIPQHLRERARETTGDYIDTLVDTVLAGARSLER